VPELRTLCEAHNLDKAGNKDVLVQRLDALRRGASEGGAAGKASPVAAASTTAARSGAATPVVTAKQRAGGACCAPRLRAGVARPCLATRRRAKKITTAVTVGACLSD